MSEIMNEVTKIRERINELIIKKARLSERLVQENEEKERLLQEARELGVEDPSRLSEWVHEQRRAYEREREVILKKIEEAQANG